MRKLKTSIAILALLAAGNAAAVDNGYVEFNGKVTDNTCSIVTGDEALQVTLPTVNRSALAKAGDQTGSTSFNIRVEKCPVSGEPNRPTQVAVHFEANGSSGANPETQNLTNASPDANKAQNVEVRLYDYGVGNGFLPVGSTGKYFNISDDGKATTTYAGGYYATGASTVGPVYAKVLYTLAYK